MTAKTVGAEWNRFYHDKAYWPDGVWHDDAVIYVNGIAVGPDFDIGNIDEAAAVGVEGGIVFDLPGIEADNGPSLEAYFKRWRKAQTTTTLLVEAPNDLLEAIKSAITSAGGKVASR